MQEHFSIVNITTGKLPRLPVRRMKHMKDTVLGKTYELSVVIAGDATLKKLNKTYRRKNQTTDVLSFSLSKNSGEIYLNPRDAARQAPDFGMKILPFLEFLFIHAMLHLKGYDHGSTMEHEEQILAKKFNLPIDSSSPHSLSWRKKSRSESMSVHIKSKSS